MARGLDGFIFYFVVNYTCGELCGFEGPPGSLVDFRWLWRGGNTSSHSEQRS